MSEQTDTIEAVANAIRDFDDPGAELAAQYAQAAIAAHTKALVDGAGSLVSDLANEQCMLVDCVVNSRLTQAAATIAALKAENERLAEREAQARIEGVRAGIEASAEQIEGDIAYLRSDGMEGTNRGAIQRAEEYLSDIRALDPAAIVEGME